jgi:hypothetical protein
MHRGRRLRAGGGHAAGAGPRSAEGRRRRHARARALPRNVRSQWTRSPMSYESRLRPAAALRATSDSSGPRRWDGSETLWFLPRTPRTQAGGLRYHPTASAREIARGPHSTSLRAGFRLRAAPTFPRRNSAANEPAAFSEAGGFTARERSGELPAADPTSRAAPNLPGGHTSHRRHPACLCASGAAAGRRLKARLSFGQPPVLPAPIITHACLVPQDDTRLCAIRWSARRKR